MQLVTWNTQWCCGLDGKADPKRIVDGARALAGPGGFDVLCLQEIAQGFEGLPGAPRDQPEQLAKLLPGYQLFFGAAVDEYVPGAGRPPTRVPGNLVFCGAGPAYTGPGPAGALQRRRFGNLIATRLPVRQVEHHRLPWPADGAVPSMPRRLTAVTVEAPGLGLVRVMTTHLEYYSPRQRMAQAEALRALHAEACEHATTPPAPSEPQLPFFGKPHTAQAILCGDFNLAPSEAEYATIQRAEAAAHHRWHDAWPLVHGDAPHAPTFRLFDRTYGPEPISCDFCFVDTTLVPHVRDIRVDGTTRASDHQPVGLILG